MVSKVELSELAINGGPKLRETPYPNRGLIGNEEKAAAVAMFDEAIATGNAFGYNGEAEEAYCREFAESLGGGFADAVNSGTNAVYVALRALNPEPFTEIVVSAVTDPGGMMPIPLLNCIPVVADAQPGRYNTGPEQVEAVLSPLTSAIVISHIGGEPADIEGIIELAKSRGIPVVEDCAQAHGASLNGRLVGTLGDISAFSTMFGKHHCTGGQGGVVFTRNEDLYWAARRASDRGKPFGLPAGSTNHIAALNLNLNDLSGAIGRVQLKKLARIVAQRRDIVDRLCEGFARLKSISVPPQVEGARHSYWFWRLQFEQDAVSCNKDLFLAAVATEASVPINASYRAAMPHLFDWFVNRRVFGTSQLPWSAPQYTGDADRQFPCPNAMAATEMQFNLHLSEAWGEREIADTVAAFEKVERAYAK